MSPRCPVRTSKFKMDQWGLLCVLGVIFLVIVLVVIQIKVSAAVEWMPVGMTVHAKSVYPDSNGKFQPTTQNSSPKSRNFKLNSDLFGYAVVAGKEKLPMMGANPVLQTPSRMVQNEVEEQLDLVPLAVLNWERNNGKGNFVEWRVQLLRGGIKSASIDFN